MRDLPPGPKGTPSLAGRAYGLKAVSARRLAAGTRLVEGHTRPRPGMPCDPGAAGRSATAVNAPYGLRVSRSASPCGDLWSGAVTTKCTNIPMWIVFNSQGARMSGRKEPNACN